MKEHDGLKCILDLLVDSNKHNKGIVTESLKLLKTLAGNDNVKKEIGESNGIHIIISAINNYVVSNNAIIGTPELVHSFVAPVSPLFQSLLGIFPDLYGAL